MLHFISVLICAAALESAAAGDPHASSASLATGRFEVAGWGGPPVAVYYAEPTGAALDDAPVVMVLHGVNRNASDYRDNWIGLAETYGLRVYAPEFTQAAFPGAAAYNLGGVGTPGPSAFDAIEPVFGAVLERGWTDGYHLFGHSAGAQVVHRALLLADLPRLKTAYAANAGWYTMPEQTVDWPYGLGGAEVSLEAERAWLSSPLIVMLGEADIDPVHPHLRRTPQADAQGMHRYARGDNFLQAAGTRAAELGVVSAWRRISVPGVAHDNAGMAGAAAADIHARRTPAQP